MEIDVIVVGKRLVFAALAVFLALAVNSYYAMTDATKALSCLALLLIASLLVALYGPCHVMSPRGVRTYFVWCVLVMTTYLVCVVHSGGSLGGKPMFGYVLLIIVFPLLIYLLARAGDLGLLMRVFSELVAICGLLSVLLWLLGPILGVIESTSMAEHTWNGSGSISWAASYFGLVFETQTISLGDAWIWRNTGLYLESPMYSYVLCVALGMEVFLQVSRRPWVIAALGVTTLSTTSTTGIVFLTACLAFLLVRFFRVSHLSTRARTALFMAVIVACASMVAVFVAHKAGSSSGNIRIDDYHAGFLAWSQCPLLGGGLDDGRGYLAYIDQSRMHNQGFSNSLFDVLMRGGLVLFVPYAVQFVGLLRRPEASSRAFALIFLFLWTVTIVSFLPLTAFVLSMGVANLMGGPVPTQGHTWGSCAVDGSTAKSDDVL